MEEYKNGLTSETISEWINSDTELYNCIIDIENTFKSHDEMAEAAFHKISELFKVPKNPEVIIKEEENEDEFEDYIEQTSVYEQLGLLKYLNSADGIRENVLTAIYFVKNRYVVDFDLVMNKYNLTATEKAIGLGFKGENTKVEIVFVKQGESWFDLGCKLFTRLI
jgi:hypothetical protein